jgi:hypothetical protein
LFTVPSGLSNVDGCELLVAVAAPAFKLGGGSLPPALVVSNCVAAIFAIDANDVIPAPTIAATIANPPSNFGYCAKIESCACAALMIAVERFNALFALNCFLKISSSSLLPFFVFDNLDANAKSDKVCNPAIEVTAKSIAIFASACLAALVIATFLSSFSCIFFIRCSSVKSSFNFIASCSIFNASNFKSNVDAESVIIFSWSVNRSANFFSLSALSNFSLSARYFS